MNEDLKSQLIGELKKAINPNQGEEVEQDERVKYHHSTHALEINEVVNLETEEQEQEKEADEEKNLEEIFRQLSAQKRAAATSKKGDVIQ